MAMMNADGSGLHTFEFDRPGQASWQAGPHFPGKRRLIVLSFEAGPAFTGNVPSHLWIHDLDTGSLDEIVPRPRLAPYYVPVLLLPKQEALLVSIIINGESRLFRMNLDGTDQREITRAGEGFSYGFSLSPDKKRLAFHASGPKPHSYRIFTSDLDGSRRVLVAGDPDHLYFGTSWSPDGQWILFQDCHFREDPGHDWSDLCIGRPDGSGHRVLTTGRSHWFGTSYGPPGNSGNGSNMPEWLPDGSAITYTRRMPGSKPAWEFQPQRPDTDHFNRDFKPELARGGTQICLLNPRGGEATPLTPAVEGQWDFRTAVSPDGRQILFSRARTGSSPAIWIMDRDGRNQRLLTKGKEDRGADFARWMP
jgi:TolB protein